MYIREVKESQDSLAGRGCEQTSVKYWSTHIVASLMVWSHAPIRTSNPSHISICIRRLCHSLNPEWIALFNLIRGYGKMAPFCHPYKPPFPSHIFTFSLHLFSFSLFVFPSFSASFFIFHRILSSFFCNFLHLPFAFLIWKVPPCLIQQKTCKY